MKANELRLGNLGNTKYDGILLTGKVVSIRENHLILNLEPNEKGYVQSHISTFDFEPIPLTEEWLVKLGAKPLAHKNILNSHIIDLGRNRILSVSVQVGNTYVWLNEVNPTDPTEITDLVCVFNQDYDGILYVHRLQNLVHSLTQTELAIS